MLAMELLIRIPHYQLEKVFKKTHSCGISFFKLHLHYLKSNSVDWWSLSDPDESSHINCK